MGNKEYVLVGRWKGKEDKEIRTKPKSMEKALSAYVRFTNYGFSCWIEVATEDDYKNV